MKKKNNTNLSCFVSVTCVDWIGSSPTYGEGFLSVGGFLKPVSLSLSLAQISFVISECYFGDLNNLGIGGVESSRGFFLLGGSVICYFLFFLLRL